MPNLLLKLMNVIEIIKMIPLFKVPELLACSENLNKVVASGWISNGQFVTDFEREFQENLSTPKYASISVGSCTDAIEIALMMILKRSKKKKILIPSLNFVAALNLTQKLNFEPVFYDISSLSNPVSGSKQLLDAVDHDMAAVVILHFAGYPACSNNLILDLMDSGLFVIEDCAHAPGARFDDGTPVGSVGQFGCFSFFSNKNIPAGEGGMLVVHNSLEKEARLIKSHGMTVTTADRYKTSKLYYDVVEVGGNFRMTEFAAAYALPQLKNYLDIGLSNRRATVQKYRADLKGSSLKLCFANIPIENSAPHILPVIFPDSASREHAMSALKANDVQYSLHYPANHKFARYASNVNSLNFTEKYSTHALTLPLYDGLTDTEVEYICNLVRI